MNNRHLTVALAAFAATAAPSPAFATDAGMHVVQEAIMACLQNVAGTPIDAVGPAFQPVPDLKSIDQGLLNPAFGTPQVARHVPFGEKGDILLIATPAVRSCTVVVSQMTDGKPLDWILQSLNASNSPFKLDQAKSMQSDKMISAVFAWEQAGRAPVNYIVSGPKDPTAYADMPQAMATVAFVKE